MKNKKHAPSLTPCLYYLSLSTFLRKIPPSPPSDCWFVSCHLFLNPGVCRPVLVTPFRSDLPVTGQANLIQCACDKNTFPGQTCGHSSLSLSQMCKSLPQREECPLLVLCISLLAWRIASCELQLIVPLLQFSHILTLYQMRRKLSWH